MTNILDYQGVSYASWFNGDFATLDSKIVFDSLAGLGTNSVAITSTFYTDGLRSSAVINDPSATESRENLAIAIQDAHARGLDVMLKPHLDPYDGQWRGQIEPRDIETFFKNYHAMILDQAQLAQDHGVALLSLGTELDQLTTAEYLPYWTKIIEDVRAIYDGDLTYSAHWVDPASVAIWDQVDIIGINPYVPLGDDPDAGPEAFADAWSATPREGSKIDDFYDGRSPIAYFSDIAAEWGKDILFTELSYTSTDRGSSFPGYSDPNGQVNMQSQADLYQAFFDVWMADGAPDWMSGVFFWNWYPHADLDQVEGWARDLTPQGKPAEAVIDTWFSIDDTVDLGLREIEVTARISGMGALDPVAHLVVDGLIVDDAKVSAELFDENWGWRGEWQEVTFTGMHRPGETVDIEIWFNEIEGGTDQNLFVDWIEVGGHRHEGEQASSNTDFGSPIDGTGTLYADGVLHFAGVAHASAPNAGPEIDAPDAARLLEAERLALNLGVTDLDGDEMAVSFAMMDWNGELVDPAPTVSQGEDGTWKLDWLAPDVEADREFVFRTTAFDGIAETVADTVVTVEDVSEPTTSILTVWAGGSTHSGVGANFTVTVDGEQLATTRVTNAEANFKGNYEAFVFEVDVNPDTVEIRFDNDRYTKGGGADRDRNLHIDRIEIDGRSYEAEVDGYYESDSKWLARKYDWNGPSEGMWANGNMVFDDLALF